MSQVGELNRIYNVAVAPLRKVTQERLFLGVAGIGSRLTRSIAIYTCHDAVANTHRWRWGA